MDSKQKLNKKLAEWAGWIPYASGMNYGECWLDGNGYYHEHPNFTNSLDVCFKWLWDKTVQELADIDLSSIEEAVHKLFQLWATEWVTDLHNEPALALCLAIEKLIDGETDDK